MRVALVNPPWTFENSIYFGCRAPHLPLEPGYGEVLVEAAALDKRCRSTMDELAERLMHAWRSVPFVQADLIKTEGDDPEMVADWRDRLRRHGIWANDPVPLYPYPSSPDYRRLWGEPGNQAWERAHAHHLAQFQSVRDSQEERPAALAELESACCR